MLALLFVGSVESVLSSLPRSASLSDEGWRRLSHNWPLTVLPREPQANLLLFHHIYTHTYIYIFIFYLFLLCIVVYYGLIAQVKQTTTTVSV